MVMAGIAIAAALNSCQKSAADEPAATNDLVNAAQMLQGQSSTGEISVQSDANAITINYNNGKRLLLIAKIPGVPIAEIMGVKTATIVTSKSGIVIRDLDAGKTYFLVNNDPQSENSCKAVQSRFTTAFQTAEIFGTTIIRLENS